MNKYLSYPELPQVSGVDNPAAGFARLYMHEDGTVRRRNPDGSEVIYRPFTVGLDGNSLQRLAEVFQDYGTFVTQSAPLGSTTSSNTFSTVKENGIYGVRQLATSGTFTSGSITFSSGAEITDSDGYVIFRFRIRFVNNGLKKTSIFGFSTTGVTYSNTSILPTNAAGFWFNFDNPAAPVVEIMTAAANIRTRTAILCNPYNWNTYEIRTKAGGIDFYLNDVLVGTITTNIPTVALQIAHFGHQENPSAGTAILRIDYYYIAPNL
ncbi:LamG domain-containing protein [Rhodoflexus caldus]|uniref:hypothetical protein n=1 Tax=Rhodoflexus caldus TaxID=2891236 RepID=UPI00202A2E35|nr:hypothetical protein [Rhodoflexus caldus]